MSGVRVTKFGGRRVIVAGFDGTIDPADMALALSNLTDVDLTGLADGDSLVWDSVSGTWVPGTGVTFGTPAIVLGTAADAGSVDEVIRRDATIVAFDATAPVTQAFSDAASAGSATVAAKRDHRHGMPARPDVPAESAAARVYAYNVFR